MGKLHKIKRAFDRATESQKKYVWYHECGCKFLDDGSVHFTTRYPTRYSYQRYIAKLAKTWIVETYGHDVEVALSD